MGLTANVFRSGKLLTALPVPAMKFHDCTINGWSVNFDQVCIINADGPSEPSDDCPAVLIVRHRLEHYNCLQAVLVEHHEAKRQTMFGGNFLYTSDSRFGELCVRLMSEGKWGIQTHAVYWSVGAVNIHDRIE